MIGKPEFIVNERVNFFYVSSKPKDIYILEENHTYKLNDYWFYLLGSNKQNYLNLILEYVVKKVNWVSLNEIDVNFRILSKYLIKFKPGFNLESTLKNIICLENKEDKVNWFLVSEDAHNVIIIAPLDTNKMKDNMKLFAEELVSYVFHPVRLNRISERLGMDLDDLLETF